jgi:CheY-like chemotaxis protein
MAAKKQLQLAFSLDDQLARIEADPKRLKQMLVNLLSNAVKFTPKGGQVSLEVETDPELGVVRLAVRDNGVGIAREDLARLFQPFTQIDSSLSRHHEGTGLGLALVRRLAELHGGMVSVESEPGRGSVFTIALPYAPAEVVADARHQTAVTEPQALIVAAVPYDEPAPAKARILLAEDTEANIMAIGDYLVDSGYELTVARNGVEALEQAAETKPDLILMDIQMPKMDGLEATRRLRAMAEFARVPIVALTGLAMPGDRERCLEAGASEYLTKPVSPRALVTVIERFLNVRSAAPSD